jgi:hypothetical protein
VPSSGLDMVWGALVGSGCSLEWVLELVRFPGKWCVYLLWAVGAGAGGLDCGGKSSEKKWGVAVEDCSG